MKTKDEEAAEAGKTPQRTPDEILADERKRVSEIESTGKKFVGRVDKIDELPREAISKGATVAEFKGVIDDRVADGKPIFSDNTVDVEEKDKRSYSISKLIYAVASGQREIGALELGISDELAKKSDFADIKIPRTRSNAIPVFVPYEMMHRSARLTPELIQFARQMGLLSKRDLSVGSATAGGNIVGTSLLANEFIDLPRNVTLYERMGARVLNGLSGNIDLPKKTGASSWYWVTTEGNAPTESELTVGKISLSPKIGGTFTDYTLKLLLQSTPSIDGLVQQDLLDTANIGVDLAGFHGTGANGQPTGIVNDSGVGTVDCADLGWDAAVEFLTDVMTGNSLAASMQWATNPTIWGFTQTRQKWPSSGQPLANENGRMAGYPINASNQIGAGYLMFGDWTQAVVGYWGGYMLLVDPYTASSSGTTRVRILAACDVQRRLSSAFSIGSNAS